MIDKTYLQQVWSYLTSIRVQTTIGCVLLVIFADRLGLTPEQTSDVRNVLIAMIIGASLRPPGQVAVAPNNPAAVTVPVTQVLPPPVTLSTRNPY